MIGLAVLAMTAALPSLAQLAPVNGMHYAGRASDTGFAGAVNSTGGYGASVPLDLSPTHGGLPLPLQVNYGGNRVGAAGLGWDIPLTYIFRSASIAHRRPKPGSFSPTPAPLAPPVHYVLMMGGESIELVRNAADTAWVALRGNTQMEVRTSGGGTLVMYDGEGRTYNFSAQGASSDTRLVNGDLFLLRSITGLGNTVRLVYEIGAPTLPNGSAALSIDLAQVHYDQHPTQQDCFKHRVYLSYDAPSAPAPLLSMSTLNGTVLARVGKLTSISVRGQPTCSEREVALRDYAFSYQADTDTDLPRLQSVTMVGQEGTPERSITLPVATYSYGSIVDPSTHSITYQVTSSTGPPMVIGADHFTFGISYTKAIDFVGGSPAVNSLLTAQSLIDATGDGRPDFIGDAGMYRNRPGPNGTTVFTPGNGIGIGTPLVPGELAPREFMQSHAFGLRTLAPFRGEDSVRGETFSQFIDMNGDGRLDLVESRGLGWRIHLNKPDPADPAGGVRVTITVPMQRIEAALRAGNTHVLPGPGGITGIPLSRKSTVPQGGFLQCFVWHALEQRWEKASSGGNVCIFPGDADPRRKQTIVEWELKDINGDGYPDFVYNVNAVRSQDPPAPTPPAPPAGTPSGTQIRLRTHSDIQGSREVRALINTAGIHLANNTEIFALAPITLEAHSENGCGVGRWEPDETSDSGGVLNQTCAFEDIDGDGIVDRITTNSVNFVHVTSAALGTGVPSQPYSADARITLPGPLARTDSDLLGGNFEFVPRNCSFGGQTFDTRRTRGLRDINGDGIPDYITGDPQSEGWAVAMGTGVGFKAPVHVNAPPWGLDPSRERNSCGREDGTGEGATVSGLYDMDGDGQPESVSADLVNKRWTIYQLKSPVAQVDVGVTASVPAAGRLTKIDNGYGAITRIGYKSAKEHASRHQLPYPEIVVTAVAVQDAFGARLESTRRYAYINANEQIFDPALDRWVFRGYERTVELRATGPGTNDAVATVTDTYGLTPFAPGMNITARLQRYLQTGRVKDVTVLAGPLGTDPWAVNVDTVSLRRVAGEHYDWGARVLSTNATPRPDGNERCIDMMFPYDFSASQANAGASWEDECTKRGFLFQKTVSAWRGKAMDGENPFTVSTTIKSKTDVQSVDDFERPTKIAMLNDLARSEDDLCVETVFATPTGTNERVLSAVASQTTKPGNCSSQSAPTLASESFEYDTTAGGTKLAPGKVAAGLPTAHLVERRDSSGQLINTVREFDAVYDSRGNPITVTMKRNGTGEDGATRTVTTAYDPFKLVPTSVQTSAVGAGNVALPSTTVSFTYDPATLDLRSSTDPNGTRYETTYDGFGRTLLSEVKPSGGTLGVLSSMSYLGFTGNDANGRRIVRKVFTDPVAPANVGTAAGRTSTVFLDEFAREARTEVALGADYSNESLMVGTRAYDQLGRVLYAADPFPKSDDASQYGTTYYYNPDGTPSCFIRGAAFEQFRRGDDESKESYSTCFDYQYHDNQRTVLTSDGPLLRHESTYSGSGQLLLRSRILFTPDVTGPTFGGVRGEAEEFVYDALGHLKQLKRFGTPASLASPVITSWQYDSLGQVLELQEPDSAKQTRTYDTWGELTRVQWNDASVSPAVDRRVLSRYDALGRLVHSEERNNDVVDAATVNDYSYDTPVNSTTPPVTATNVLGRLAKATSPTSTVSFSYDAFGDINAKIFTDTTVNPAKVYVEKHTYHGDGSPSALDLKVPSSGTTFTSEHVAYTYDSAGRTRSMTYSDGAITQSLFSAPGASAIDVFGQIRTAQYGAASITANYSNTGRRLISSTRVTTPSGATREISFPAPTGAVTAFDRLGREIARRESINGVATTISFVYDRRGVLTSSARSPVSPTVPDMTFSYNALGNILGLSPATGSSAARLSYQSVDLDRICGIAYGGGSAPATCNVTHNAAGAITQMPTRSNGTRVLTYFNGGGVKRVTDGNGNDAQFRYDAFGELQQLDLTSNTSADTRHDRHFGGLILQHDEVVGGTRTQVITRTIAGPGFVATRHGSATSSPWTFAFSEPRGNRFFTNQAGEFVQDVDYQSYGEAASSGAQPGAPTYTSAQWNGGDTLAALGLSHLGARLYDPVIGRFLSRDPVLILSSAARANPYAFAFNDPVNYSDPSGLDPGETPTEPPPSDCRQTGTCTGGPGGPGFPNPLKVIHDAWCATAGWGCGGDPEPATSTYSSSGGSGKSAGSGGNGFPANYFPLPDNLPPSRDGVGGVFDDFVKDVYQRHGPDGVSALEDALLESIEGGYPRPCQSFHECFIGLVVGLISVAAIVPSSGFRLRPAIRPGMRDITQGAVSGATRGTNTVRVGGAVGFARGTEVTEIAKTLEDLIRGGATEISVGTGVHGSLWNGGTLVTEASFLAEDLATASALQARYPGVQLKFYDLSDPFEYQFFLRQQAKASVGGSVCSVAAFCNSAAIILHNK
jgi:RHS repeat-associated protein